MPALGDFDVQVVHRKSGTPLATVNHQGTKYVVAEAGEEFQIKVRLTQHNSKDHEVFVKIDGQDVGYSKVFYAHYATNKGVFEGFLRSTGKVSPAVYDAFKFGACKPSNQAALVQHPDEIKAGIIEVKCDEVFMVGPSDPNAPIAPARLNNDAEKKKLPEGKKWFLAPGLKAEAGSAVKSNINWCKYRYISVRTVHTMKLRYDTVENLVLRKILNRSNAAHRAILRTAKEAHIAAMGRDPQEASSRPRANGVKREGAAAVKRERGIKRERDHFEGPDVPRSATGEVLDLTGQVQPGPMVVNGKALGADELAVCDLCDSDDDVAAAPAAKWTVQKKQAIDL